MFTTPADMKVMLHPHPRAFCLVTKPKQHAVFASLIHKKKQNLSSTTSNSCVCLMPATHGLEHFAGFWIALSHPDCGCLQCLILLAAIAMVASVHAAVPPTALAIKNIDVVRPVEELFTGSTSQPYKTYELFVSPSQPQTCTACRDQAHGQTHRRPCFTQNMHCIFPTRNA